MYLVFHVLVLTSALILSIKSMNFDEKKNFDNTLHRSAIRIAI